jgi:hypothetical protein
MCPALLETTGALGNQPIAEVASMPTISPSSLKRGDTLFAWTLLTDPARGDRKEEGNHFFAVCRCECGTERRMFLSNLVKGHSKSCGCRKGAAISAHRKTHGATVANGGEKTREYRAWRDMKNRCLNPNVKSYQHYGGRGIVICDRWLNSFEAFLEDMGPCPPGLTIDRIENERGYEPGNCRWADRMTQARNRRTVRWITFRGETLCLHEWAERIGINPCGLGERLGKGWGLEEALTTPKFGRNSGKRGTQ